jgi:hypothetical protein
MEELFKKFVGRHVDIAFGANSVVRGEVTEVRDGIAFLTDEDQRSAFVALDKISVVWEVKEAHSRPGFVV